MKKKKPKTVNLFKADNSGTTEVSYSKYPLKNYKSVFKTDPLSRHVYITNTDFINSLQEGIFVKVEKEEHLFILMPSPKLYYDIENSEFCYEVNYGDHIYKASDYLKTWYFYSDAQRGKDEDFR
jgi:hypothetical protein